MLKQGSRAFSRGATGVSELRSCCEEKLGVPFKSLQGNQALLRVEEELRVLSTCGRSLGVPIAVQYLRQASC